VQNGPSIGWEDRLSPEAVFSLWAVGGSDGWNPPEAIQVGEHRNIEGGNLPKSAGPDAEPPSLPFHKI